MMKHERDIARQLAGQQIISPNALSKIETYLNTKKISLHWELRTLLYIGISLFTTGLGIFVYNNIGSIGHVVLLFILFAGCAGAYWYAFKHALSYTHDKTTHSNPFYDYVVLLAASLFVIAQGYLEFQFALLGNALSIASLAASLVLGATAFRFDHKGVLGIAISIHALFFGLAVTPLDLLKSASGTADPDSYIHSGLLLGGLLYMYGYICRLKAVKPHFVNTFFQFSVNLLFISLLAGMFSSSFGFLYYLALLTVSVLWFRESRKMQSFALFFSLVMANYIALSYWICKGALATESYEIFYLLFFYFTGTAVGIVMLLRNHKKIWAYDQV